MSASWDEVLQFRLRHKSLRTAARTSMKVASSLEYQLACRIGSVSGYSTLVINTTRLKIPKRQGVVRSIPHHYTRVSSMSASGSWGPPVGPPASIAALLSWAWGRACLWVDDQGSRVDRHPSAGARPVSLVALAVDSVGSRSRPHSCHHLPRRFRGMIAILVFVLTLNTPPSWRFSVVRLMIKQPCEPLQANARG